MTFRGLTQNFDHPIALALLALQCSVAGVLLARHTMPVEGELLGDARLRQGLTYYPAVYVKEQVVAVGNVVKIQRLTGAGKPDISFGHLKGIWLWRDKPYIRVQYLAPVLANPPEESIAFKGTLSSGATEVLITSCIRDVPLVSFVFINT